ncbi:hypothetical protein AJ79_02978 [Helicocarpus griseus UAMH5409]|uniref:Methyltransferase domain-containing protein n=1 Tax=Helicocarpus griseus UAMH5409 TaxID=1447875 RepID=A0A2B7XZW4_9EURO|nr:hypothetical protein AJ79_02978 [Helicocarpus griseus UAMH5409]
MPSQAPGSPEQPPAQGYSVADVTDPSQGNIEVDNERDGELDSAFGDSTSTTASLTSTVLNFHFENGRRYHSYKEGKYPLPNDEKEQDRLDIMHRMYSLVIGDRLYLAPIGSNPQRILDLGTGTGLWAIEMADAFPSALVIGNDLSPIQPSFVPPNVRFEIDDIEEDFAHSEPFDYIHARYLAGSIKDWPALIRQTFRALKPGGWAEYFDCDFALHSDDDSLKKNSALATNIREIIEASESLGRTACPGPGLKGWFKEAGFVNITERKFIVPFTPWPKDRKLKEIGAWNNLQSLEGVEGWSMALLTRDGRMSPEEVQRHLVEVRKDMANPAIHAYYHLYVVFGQRPQKN